MSALWPASRCGIYAREFFPFRSRSEGFEIQEGTAVQAYTSGSYHARQTQKRPLIDLIATEQIAVVAKLAEKPIQFPESLRIAIQAAGDQTVEVSFGFDDLEPKSKERFLRMPAVTGAIDANQKDSFEQAVSFSRFQL
jgi:hypothetical protein